MTYENINNLLLKQVDNISRVSANASIQGQIHILKQVMIYLQSEIQKLEKREEETREAKYKAEMAAKAAKDTLRKEKEKAKQTEKRQEKQQQKVKAK